MRKNKEKFKKIKKLKKFKKIIALFLVILTLFVGHRFYLNHTYGIKTEVALKGTINKSFYSEGFIIRRETEIMNSQGSSVNFLLNDGEKINKGGVIAQIYKNESNNLQQKEIDKIDKEIANLEILERDKNKISTNLTSLDKRTHQNLKALFDCVNEEDYQDLSKNKEDLLYLMNERQALIDKTYSFSERIEDLKSQREKIKIEPNEKLGTIVASESGYFVGNTDGFENVVDYDAAKSISSNQLKGLLSANEKNTGAVAKIVNLSYWYVACNVKKDSIKSLQIGDIIDLSLPSVNLEKIPATVVAINTENNSSDVCIVLKSNYLNKDILNLRKENIRLDFSEHAGLKINKKAVHEKVASKTVKNEDGQKETIEKKIQGVYVIKNKQLIFKEIIITYADEDYVICKEKPDEDELFTEQYLEQYDEIVIKGADLHEGKKVKR